MHVRWKRSTGDYVESHCGRWWITPIYGGCTRPERYELRLDNRVIGGGQNQRACKEDADRYDPPRDHQVKTIDHIHKGAIAPYTRANQVKTIDHIRKGAIARYTRANGFKLAVCVGFGHDSRPRVRFYRATAGKWTSPELVDRAHLAPLGKIEIDGPSRQHGVLTKALEALWTTPKLGFGPARVALLVAGDGARNGDRA